MSRGIEQHNQSLLLDRRGFLAGGARAILLAAGVQGAANAADRSATQIFDLDHLHADSETAEGPYKSALPPDKRLGIAIVGLGNLTITEILPAIASCKYARLAALVTGHRDKGLRLAAEYGVPQDVVLGYEQFEKLADNPAVGAVYIVLPNSMHAEYTVRAAKMGKHVLCEKPMANTAAQCRQMIDACKNAGRKLMIAYRIQYEPNNQMMRDFVRDGRFGRVRIVQATNVQNQGQADQWRHKRALAGGGALPDIGIYCLNTTRFLLGQEPIEVFASMYSTPDDPRFAEVEESMSFQMRFADGVMAVCDTSYSAHACRQYRVMAERAWFGMDPAFAYHGLRTCMSKAQGASEVFSVPSIVEQNQFALEIDHFADCVLNNRDVATPGEEGLRDQLIMEALYKSARENVPIKL